MTHKTDLADFTATELLRAYRRREASPVEAAKAALARIDRFDADVNAFCFRDDDTALAMARASEARWVKGEPCGLTDGIPTTIKDLYQAKGWPTLRGSRTVSVDQPWNEDHPSVARLRERGAVFIGKTTTPEFGWKGVTDSPLTGITRNPWDTSRTPGGSSGGAAVAAALGMGTLHIGSDGGGSIRMPSGFTGIFGLKPTFGRVPSHPPSLFGTISHMGPMTRTVTDAALMLNVVTEPDARAWHALPLDGVDYRVGLEEGVAGLRIAFSPALGYARVDPEVAAAVRAAVASLADLGAHVAECDPGLPDPIETFDRHWFIPSAYVFGLMTPEQQAVVDPGFREVAELGARYGLMDYMQAMNDRAKYASEMSVFLDRFDLLITPTLAVPAFAAGALVADPATQTRWTDWTPFSYPFNLTQQPAASVPVGFTRGGLPIGMQIVGGKYKDALVLRAARAYESQHPFRMPAAPNVTHR
jgi:aspartyl-tRNA(Asn)/glutamyl-tRNA(Gln) amidotransferase subunit A